MGCQTTRYRIQSNSCPNRTWGRSHLGSGQGKIFNLWQRKKEKLEEVVFVDEFRPSWLGWFDVTRWHDKDVWRTRDVSRMTTGKSFRKVSFYIFPRQSMSRCLKLFMNYYPFHQERGTNKYVSYPQGVALRLADFVRPMLYHWRRENSRANWGLP